MIKRTGLRWVLLDGSEMVESLSYNGNLDAFKGISRSVFPALNYRVSMLLLLSIVLMCVALLPVVHLADIALLGAKVSLLTVVSVLSILVVGVSWFIVCWRFNHSLFMCFLFPFSITLVVVIAYYSMCARLLSVASWKGRDMIGRKIRI